MILPLLLLICFPSAVTIREWRLSSQITVVTKVSFTVTCYRVILGDMKAKRIPVNVDHEDFQRLKTLSDRTGIPASNLLRRALSAWLDENESRLLKVLATK